MKSDQYMAIEYAIHIIEANLKNLLDLDELSKQVGISKYHLHRLFKSLTGKSLMAYVRSRKLSASLSNLLHTQLHIIDIASEYHFAYEQSYIRAFKQFFHMTPAQYRKHRGELTIEQKIDPNRLQMIGDGILLDPRMCMRSELYLQGIKKEVVHEENFKHHTANAFAKEFQKHSLPLIQNAVNADKYIGLVLYSTNPVYSNYYMPSIEVTHSTDKVPSPLVQHTIVAHEYAVFRYIGFHSPYDTSFVTLKGLYDAIDQWKTDSSYYQAEAFHFEQMDLGMCSPTYCELDIYVPICTGFAS